MPATRSLATSLLPPSRRRVRLHGQARPAARGLAVRLVAPLSLLVLGGCAGDPPGAAGARGSGSGTETAAGTSSPSAQSPGLQSQAAPPDDSLVLMSWNVEWMWDGIAPEDGDIEFERKGDPVAARAHMEAIARVVRDADPDIVNLVEIEGRDALELLESQMLADAGYEVGFVQGQDRATGQDLGILSRYPILAMDRDPTEGRSGRTRKRVSKNYFASIDVPARDTTLRLGLVGLHFLAKPFSESRRERREAQADVIRTSARRLAGQGRSLVVWGDFNDFDGALRDREDSRPITRVLSWIRALDPDDATDDLDNVLARLPRRDRYTSRHRNAIDHVLLSPDLAARVESVEILHHVQVSNHYPVLVELSLDRELVK